MRCDFKKFLLAGAFCFAYQPLFAADAWERYDPAITMDMYKHPVPSANFVVLDESSATDQIALLDKQPFYKISNAQAVKYTKGKINPPANAYSYLVRGLTLGLQTGHYTLYFSNHILSVQYGALAHRDYPKKHEILVVYLPNELKELYVFCHSAE